MSNKMIEEGDEVYVQIDMEDNVSVTGIVCSRPQATGDSWVIENDNGLHYIQMFCRMTRTKEPRP